MHKFMVWDRVNLAWKTNQFFLENALISANGELRFPNWAHYTKLRGTDFGVYTVPYQDGDLEIIEWTGFKDRSGDEIYEGDIVLEGGKYGSLYYVEWGDDGAYVLMEKMDIFDVCQSQLTSLAASKCQVVGSIHEHLKFLEGQSKK